MTRTVRTACDRCTQRKVKCSGCWPCQHCIRRSETCTYSQACRVTTPRGQADTRACGFQVVVQTTGALGSYLPTAVPLPVPPTGVAGLGNFGAGILVRNRPLSSPPPPLPPRSLVPYQPPVRIGPSVVYHKLWPLLHGHVINSSPPRPPELAGLDPYLPTHVHTAVTTFYQLNGQSLDACPFAAHLWSELQANRLPSIFVNVLLARAVRQVYPGRTSGEWDSLRFMYTIRAYRTITDLFSEPSLAGAAALLLLGDCLLGQLLVKEANTCFETGYDMVAQVLTQSRQDGDADLPEVYRRAYLWYAAHNEALTSLIATRIEPQLWRELMRLDTPSTLDLADLTRWYQEATTDRPLLFLPIRAYDYLGSKPRQATLLIYKVRYYLFDRHIVTARTARYLPGLYRPLLVHLAECALPTVDEARVLAVQDPALLTRVVSRHTYLTAALILLLMAHPGALPNHEPDSELTRWSTDRAREVAQRHARLTLPLIPLVDVDHYPALLGSQLAVISFTFMLRRRASSVPLNGTLKPIGASSPESACSGHLATSVDDTLEVRVGLPPLSPATTAEPTSETSVNRHDVTFQQYLACHRTLGRDCLFFRILSKFPL
ncbi:hypothetical protein IWQ60_005987 [Tieghemiomyces parasiticus]|uniref:Zn(2)-C6 fungal-type domain-containing protein n=1 Tax=Tieghemiomyces parasiticus TaxID=78921 RepID=A0A9W8AD14_9FUNG|nr:hypothetical protein IWQ60_005987 [Tieghemiomyces parasiticus]